MTQHLPIRGSLVALLAALTLSGCAVFRTPAPLTPDLAYQRGMEAYQAGRYRTAAERLNDFVTVATGDPRLRDALMALAESQLRIREHLTAASSYLRVVTEFPADPQAVTARFGLCDAYRRMSPRPQLDQQYTLTAITYCDSYAGLYPDTPEAARARQWIAEMRVTLGQKAYLNGVFYLRRGAPDAAIIYFQEAVEEYPETPAAPASLQRMAEAYDRLGYREEAAAARERLRVEYPQSEEARGLGS